jgi:hypothetical protein
MSPHAVVGSLHFPIKSLPAKANCGQGAVHRV